MIITDSACDMTQKEAAELGVEVLPLKARFGDEEYLDGVTMDHGAFFTRLIETDVFPTTSQIGPYEYGKSFKKHIEAGEDVLCVTISSKLSGCYQSAALAAGEHPGRVWVVDSENVCIGQRILIEYAVRLSREGLTVPQIAERL